MPKKELILLLLMFTVIGCTNNVDQEQSKQMKTAMSSNFKSFIDQAWNKKDMDSLRLVADEGYVRRLNGIEVAININELEANMNIFFMGFPDLEIRIDKSIIKDSLLFAKWTFKGTNTGVFGESPATGKSIVVHGFSELIFDTQGKIKKEDVYYNELELLQQLGYSLNPPIVE